MQNSKKDSIILYSSYIDTVQLLSPEEAGHLFMALLDYNDPTRQKFLTPAAKIAYMMMRAQILRDRDKYLRKCEQNRQNALSKREGERETLREQEED